jgi:hypothetical protein
VSKKPTGGPAFPLPVYWDENYRAAFAGDAESPGSPAVQGLTIRDYLAGQALAGILANPNKAEAMAALVGDFREEDRNEVSKVARDALCAGCYEFADAMLREREREVQP